MTPIRHGHDFGFTLTAVVSDLEVPTVSKLAAATTTTTTTTTTMGVLIGVLLIGGLERTMALPAQLKASDDHM